jgi:hypothetical protein
MLTFLKSNGPHVWDNWRIQSKMLKKAVLVVRET